MLPSVVKQRPAVRGGPLAPREARDERLVPAPGMSSVERRIMRVWLLSSGSSLSECSGLPYLADVH
jgi:hypothetical protein